MLTPKAEVGSWVSEAARAKFLAAYERAFALWPQPHEEFDVETATSITRVHAYRPHPDGAPVVLLTGAGFNASGWYSHVAALARHHPVARAAPWSPRRRLAPEVTSCRTPRSPSCPAATAASIGSTS